LSESGQSGQSGHFGGFPRLKRLLKSQETEAIINYLQQHPNSTIDKVAKHLQDNNVCSRLTTLSAIEQLLVVGVIKDDRKGKYFHSLSYDENFNFKGLAANLLRYDVQEDLDIFDRFVYRYKAPSNDEIMKSLFWYFDDAVREHYRSKQIPYLEKDLTEARAEISETKISKEKEKSRRPISKKSRRKG